MKQSLYKTCSKCAEEFIVITDTSIINEKVLCPGCHTIGKPDYIIVGPEDVEKVQVKSCNNCNSSVSCPVITIIRSITLGNRSSKYLSCCLHKYNE